MSEQNTAPDFNEGFTHSNDTFKRKEFYEQVMRVIDNAPEKNLVFSLDDRWGNGKTSFVQMMKAEIELDDSKNYNVIYFDAFEHDYQSDPFISLTAQIYSLIKKDESKLRPFKDRFIQASKKVGASLLINGMKAVISTATAGVVDGGKVVDAATKVVKDSAESLTDELESFIEKKITSADEEKQDIHNFKKILKDMHSESEVKTIFIIDELDRARPDYALDLLEKVKHLFSVEGVIFMLVMNRNQFEKSIEQRYGQIDSRSYLNKFINYWLTLPKTRSYEYSPHNAHNETTITEHFNEINKQRKLLTRNGQLIKSLSFLLDINDCSLREAERCYSLLQITYDADSLSMNSEHLATIAIITFLKVNKPELLESFMQKNITKDNFHTEIGFNKHMEYVQGHVQILYKAVDFHYLEDEALTNDETAREYQKFVSWMNEESPFVRYYKRMQNLSMR